MNSISYFLVELLILTSEHLIRWCCKNISRRMACFKPSEYWAIPYLLCLFSVYHQRNS